MKWPKTCCVLILAATIGAAVLRVPKLVQRPMHGDEAVHAYKFDELLENGVYSYDPNEYHGPTLNYLTLVPAWISGAKKFSQLNEFTLRIVPVFLGVCLVLLTLLLVNGLGSHSTVVASVITAISPAMVFYSRYYIQEMLLVCFTFAVITCGYRYTRSKSIGWALSAGMFLGLMHATKETCVIAFGSMLLALLLVWLIWRRQESFVAKTLNKAKIWHLIAAIAVAAIISALFHSSFLTNPAGIVDSLRTYSTYLARGSQNQLHIHPWHYYLKMLLYWQVAAGPAWSEALIVVLAVVGFIAVIIRKPLLSADYNLLRFIAFYAAIMTLVYSTISYKTPWCLLGFLHGMILLAGTGVLVVVKLAKNILGRTIIILLLIAGGANLAWQAYLSSYKYYANPRNPYVYAHPTTDVFTIVQRVDELSQVHSAGYRMNIQVICPEHDYWPLPWYLRRFEEQKSVVWYDTLDYEAPPAPVIIALASVEPALMEKLAKMSPSSEIPYVPAFNLLKQLRPQVELRCYVAKDLWDSYQQHLVQSILSQPGR